MTAKEKQSVDMIIGKLDAMAESARGQRETLFQKVDEVKDEINALKAIGCTQGRRNAEDIEELQQETKKLDKRLVAITAAIVLLAEFSGHVPDILKALM